MLLKSMAPDWAAILLSVGFVVIFGEVLPSAIMTGPLQMILASKIVPIIQATQAILFFICYPISLLLDHIFGEHTKRYHLQQIKTLLEIHMKSDVLNENEVTLIDGIMEMRNQTVNRNYIPLRDLFHLKSYQILDQYTISRIKKKGFTTIPVLENNIIIGTLNTKRLLTVNNEIVNFIVDKPLIINSDTTMLELLRLLQKYKKSVAFIYDQQLLGMITLNEVFESIAGQGFQDDDSHQITLR
ncbi:hypothetical protein pb186bvf_003408 [Paramecium bursaria]